MDALRQDASSIDWTPVLVSDSIDEKVRELEGIILKLYDVHAPIRRVKVRHDPAPWLTDYIKTMMAKRDKAKLRFRRCPTDQNLARYKFLRNHCSRLCRDAKRRHNHNSVENCNPTQVWKFLRSLGIGKISTSSDNSVDLNALNTHFSIPPVTLDTSIKSSTISFLESQTLPACAQFCFTTISEEDVKKHVLAITSKAVGNDNLCSRMISLILSELLPILTHIFNYSLVTRSFPSAWKRANVIPLPKIANPTSFSHFRPISILPFLSKVLEHIVHKQLADYITSNSLLSPFQSGFRKGHSTVTALLKVTEDIRLAMENKSLTILTLLDFSSAFNSVDFDVLISILRSFNISPSVIDWFNSYLRGRSQRVRSDETSSDWCDLVAGVPQGGVLSPLLFSIFINTVT